MFKIFFKKDDSYEFKPILSEIEDEPINPIGPAVFWIIIIFILIAALWMYFGKVDVVITARGVVIPDGEEKVVQSLDKGVLKSLLIKEGDYTEKGQILGIEAPAEQEPELELINLKEEENALLAQIASIISKLKMTRADEARLRQVLDIIPKTRYDEVNKEIAALGYELKHLQASLSEIRNKRIQIKNREQILKSPVEGYIGQIFIHTEGAIVNPAEKIVTVIPKDARLKIKASVLNRDIGFVKKEMPVSIKLDAYDFQKYGIIDGKVDVVSPGSIEDENLGRIYEIYIRPDKNTILADGKKEAIKPGMTTTNEIKTGKRRIVEFFIYPLVKYLDEGIKVR